MEIRSNQELRIFIASALRYMGKGAQETLMLDRFLTQLEQIAEISYDGEGNIQFYEVTVTGQPKIGEDGKAIEVTKLKAGAGTLELKNCREWTIARLKLATGGDWTPAQRRTAMKLYERFGGDVNALDLPEPKAEEGKPKAA